MNVPMIVGVLVFFIVLGLVFRALKGALRIVMSVLSVLLVIFVLISIVVYMDARSMNGLIREGNKTMVYIEDDRVLAGATITSGSLIVEGEGALPENIVALDQERRDVYGLVLSGMMSPDHELVIVVTNRTFKDQTSFSLNHVNISKEGFFEVMRSDEPREALVKEAASGQESARATEQVVEGLDTFDDDELKAALFLMAFSQTVHEGDVSFIVRSIRDESIRVHPSFHTLKLIKIVPDKVLERSLEETMVVHRRDG